LLELVENDVTWKRVFRTFFWVVILCLASGIDLISSLYTRTLKN